MNMRNREEKTNFRYLLLKGLNITILFQRELKEKLKMIQNPNQDFT